MQTAPDAHPLAISTPFSSASLHQFEDGLFRIREDMMSPAWPT